MKIVISIAVTAVLIWNASPSAQELPGRGRGGFPGLGLGFGVDILRVEPLELFEPVTDAPYSAETVTELVQQLGDGNRIEQRTKGRVARDSRGRVRREQTVAGFGSSSGTDAVRIITITDPNRREHYRLDESRKIAWRLQLSSAPPRREERRDRPGPPPPQSMRTEQLDPKQFDGVKAEGTRAVLMLPAGAIGNERAIEVTSERWYASDLKVVVATKRTDPRFGDVTYRLVNIARSEPPAHLFDVPADFTIRDQPPFPPPPR
jgi:hypothetical protein